MSYLSPDYADQLAELVVPVFADLSPHALIKLRRQIEEREAHRGREADDQLTISRRRDGL